MKISTRFSDSIHILAFINIYHGKVPLTSNNIASSIGTSPVVVRRLMSQLRKAGLLNTVHGAAEPSLAKDPTAISLYDVFLAVEDDPTSLQLTARPIQNALSGVISRKPSLRPTTRPR